MQCESTVTRGGLAGGGTVLGQGCVLHLLVKEERRTRNKKSGRLAKRSRACPLYWFAEVTFPAKVMVM